MTNLPNSEQSGDLDNINVTRGEFREDIGVFLEYVAQALGGVTGNYTTQAINPQTPILQGSPTLEPGATPPDDSRDDRIPSTRWVQEHGRYVGSTSPTSPADGMLWVDTSGSPYQLAAYNSTNTDWDVLSGFPAGTRMLFQQQAAPSGWTKVTSGVDNMALRVTTGNPSIVDSNQPFTTAFSNKSVSGSVASTSLSINQMPGHSHGVSDPGHSHSCNVNDPGHAHAFNAAKKIGDTRSGDGDKECDNKNLVTSGATTGISVSANGASSRVTIQNNGSGQGHSHGFTGGSVNLNVNYVDVIIAQKD